jgi:CRP-like cAMP-binding protein
VPSHQIGDQNAILERLSKSDREALLRTGKKIPMVRAEVLHEPRGEIAHVYFPLSGMISLLAVMGDGDAIETGIVGREGLAGGSIGSDGGVSFGQAIVQIPGSAWRVPAAVFRQQYEASPEMRQLVNQYQNYVLIQAQQSAGCHATHSVEARMCRWLLQSRDTLGSDTVELTQEFLSHMLGVQRSTVSLSAHSLQQAGLIRYTRGKVQILDAAGMEESACECYGVLRHEAHRLAK